MTKRFVALLVSLFLVGCTAAIPERKTAEPEAEAIVTLRLLGMPGDPVTDALISAFYQQHSNIRIEKVPYVTGNPSVIKTTEILREKLKQGEVDIFPAMDDAPMLARDGSILALDPYFKKSGFDPKPFESTMGPLRIEGKTYGLPIFTYPQAILYNADLFAAKGVPLPKAGWTWEEFRAAALALTSGSGESKVWGFATDYGPAMLAYSMLYQRTGDGSIDLREVKQLLQYWSTVIDTDRSVAPSPKQEAGSVTYSSPMQPFAQGQAAMTLVSLNSYQWLLRNAKFRWDLAPMPVFAGGNGAVEVHARGYGIAANSPHTDSAWTFLRFLASEEGAIAVTKAGHLPVLRTEPVKRAWFEQSPPPPRSTEYYFTAELRSGLAGDSNAGMVMGLFAESLTPVLQGGANWEALYEQFAAKQDKVLNAPSP